MNKKCFELIFFQIYKNEHDCTTFRETLLRLVCY